MRLYLLASGLPTHVARKAYGNGDVRHSYAGRVVSCCTYAGRLFHMRVHLFLVCGNVSQQKGGDFRPRPITYYLFR
jgi:hypothetical protein